MRCSVATDVHEILLGELKCLIIELWHRESVPKETNTMQGCKPGLSGKESKQSIATKKETLKTHNTHTHTQHSARKVSETDNKITHHALLWPQRVTAP